jgi:hypothetical protein
MSPDSIEAKIQQLEAKIGELEAKVQYTKDVQEIEQLERIYGYYLDANMMEDVAALFSDDCESVEIANRGVYLGKKGVERFFTGAQAQDMPNWRMGRHMQLQGVTTINPDGKTANGRWHVLFLATSNSEPRICLPLACWDYGVYENKFVK